MYLFVNTSTLTSPGLGSSAILESSLINPPPKYHSNKTSAYYKSCFIRFFYRIFVPNQASFALHFIEKGPVDRPERLWFLYDSKGNKISNSMWTRQVVLMPENITNRYMLQFEVRRGFRGATIAIDDVTMSPECFGLNVPENETAGYDYDNFDGYVEPTKVIRLIDDFAKTPKYTFTSCGAKGRLGPTPENCSIAYNNTNTNVTVLQDAGLLGVQRWIVPEDGYYTVIAKGASGGKGSGGRGPSKGATAMGIVRLNKTQALYVIVGQEGGSACHKSFAFTSHYNCGGTSKNKKKTDPLKELQSIQVLREGGGGGGASAVYVWYKVRGRIALVIGGGGGGLGHNHESPNYMEGTQDGYGYEPKIRDGFTGTQGPEGTAGAGGGWIEGNRTTRSETGQALINGAQGGHACGRDDDSLNPGFGGFGGGGGGCATGGGGGGYAGGSTYSNKELRIDGQGGHSYVANMMMLSRSDGGSSRGPGSVVIIPAIPRGCGCAYICVALDEFPSKSQCMCPSNQMLMDNGLDCEDVTVPVKMQNDRILTVLAVIVMAILITVLIFFIYKHQRHLQRKKALLRVNKMDDSALQLNPLRVASDGMMTEYNPNYEFGGGTYTIRDLPEVPREHLRLVKALGQGAFGEVYQGFYRHRSGDAVEMPVAVKTLPELSTNQAETDFLMEALIMSKFGHPNIVHFIGVCFDRHPRLIVLELLAGGDLKNFLRESRPKPERPSPLNVKDLLMCAIDVAKGCSYLEEHHFIHRDIAARNCLLTTKGPGRTCKIADFGMARDIYRCDYYRKGGKAMLPIKWMPPEAFQDGIFTSKTDVWSFGVLLWEVMSLGYMPYTGCGNREVMQLVITGGRLEPPCNCPEPVYAIMTKCWHPKPDERPSFKMIIERLGYCLQDPDVLNTPLPIFNRLTWTDRDTTATQSEGTSTLRGSADYLEPNRGMITPESLKSTEDGWKDGYSSENSLAEPLLEPSSRSSEHLLGNHNCNRRPLTATLSLDASTLAKQPVPYAKHSGAITNMVDGTPAAPSSPYTIPANGRIRGDAEISC